MKTLRFFAKRSWSGRIWIDANDVLDILREVGTTHDGSYVADLIQESLRERYGR